MFHLLLSTSTQWHHSSPTLRPDISYLFTISARMSRRFSWDCAAGFLPLRCSGSGESKINCNSHVGTLHAPKSKKTHRKMEPWHANRDAPTTPPSGGNSIMFDNFISWLDYQRCNASIYINQESLPLSKIKAKVKSGCHPEMSNAWTWWCASCMWMLGPMGHGVTWCACCACHMAHMDHTVQSLQAPI